MHLGAMSMASCYHACIGQSGIRSRAGALDICIFLTTAAISSTEEQSSRVFSRDQFDANSLWHWRRRKTGCSSSGRRGSESRCAIISSTTERRSVCLTARSPGEKRRDSASANLFATDYIHSDESWSSSSSSTFFKRRGFLTWACWTPRMSLSRERHSICRRRASIRILPPSSRVLLVFP
jgi:hypothetical protein